MASRLLGSTAEKLEAVGKLLRVTRTPKLGEQLQVLKTVYKLVIIYSPFLKFYFNIHTECMQINIKKQKPNWLPSI